MGKSTISMAMFHSYVKLPEGINVDQLVCLLGQGKGKSRVSHSEAEQMSRAESGERVHPLSHRIHGAGIYMLT